MKYFLSLLIFLSCYSLPSYADIIAEGWYKVLSANVHVGYVATRFEYDPANKQFSSKSFLKTNAAGGNITESMVVHSDEGMKPIKYQYTSLKGTEATKIDAEVKKGQLVIVKQVGGKTITESSKLEKGVFFSSHLPLLMLKKGLKVGVNFSYKAIAEEDGKVYDGKSFIKEIKKAGTKDLFRILNDYKGVKFVSLIDTTGQIVATKAPLLGLVTNLQVDQKTATGNIPVPKSSLTRIFGKKLP